MTPILLTALACLFVGFVTGWEFGTRAERRIQSDVTREIRAQARKRHGATR